MTCHIYSLNSFDDIINLKFQDHHLNLMKTAIILALLVALIAADYVPDWHSCSDPSDTWQPTNVTLAQPPARNEDDSIHACGTIEDDVIIGDALLNVYLAKVKIFTTTVKLTQQEVFPGTQYCFDYSVYIPPIAVGTFNVSFELQDNTQNNLGCVYLDFSL